MFAITYSFAEVAMTTWQRNPASGDSNWIGETT